MKLAGPNIIISTKRINVEESNVQGLEVCDETVIKGHETLSAVPVGLL